MRLPSLTATLAAYALATIFGQASAQVAKPASRPPVAGPFLVKPYLQLGYSSAPGRLAVAWHAADVDSTWKVEWRPGEGATWRPAGAPSTRRVAVPGIEPHRVHHVDLEGLPPGGAFAYRVLRGDDIVFQAEAKGPASSDQPHRFALFGDCGANTPEQRAVADRAFREKPDYVMITGDIVYGRGLIAEYREKYWPIYNADEAAPGVGAPLLRSTLFVAAPGNHDIASRDLGKNPDGLAYFHYWLQPLNGPEGQEGGSLVAPLTGPGPNRKAFLEAAGEAFPRMASFSFDYGNAHWTVLDSNGTVDWTDPALRKWVEDDLASARGATWRLVSFHHPGFNSSKAHFNEQYMRILSPVFEAGKVDVVFAGHVHNYQRSHPLRFEPSPVNGASPRPDPLGARPKTRTVDGRYAFDRTFDGDRDTTPEGVIYIVSGAGGQRLYNPEQQDRPETWQPFTLKHVSKVHSFSVVDVGRSELTLRQIAPDGIEVDRFRITR